MRLSLQEELATSPAPPMSARGWEPTPSQVNTLFIAAGRLHLFTPPPPLLHPGSGRYIPGSGPDPGAPVGVADPFTGEQRGGEGSVGGAEVTVSPSSGGGAYSSAALRQTATNIYFPKTDALTFEQANPSQIFGE